MYKETFQGCRTYMYMSKYIWYIVFVHICYLNVCVYIYIYTYIFWGSFEANL